MTPARIQDMNIYLNFAHAARCGEGELEGVHKVLFRSGVCSRECGISGILQLSRHAVTVTIATSRPGNALSNGEIHPNPPSIDTSLHPDRSQSAHSIPLSERQSHLSQYCSFHQTA